MQPASLSKNDRRELQITWTDGLQQVIPFRVLRNGCPCALCLEKKMAGESRPSNLLPILSPEEAQPLNILSMRPVGNYAYQIQFSDGHSSGLFTYELLRSLK